MLFTENSFIIFATLTGEHLGIPTRVYACVACVTWRFWLLSNKGGRGQRNREEIGAGSN